MIVVIADDITGAAELGGIGLRYGLRVVISATASSTDQIDLLVVYTNTRSLKKEDAVKVMQSLSAEAKALNPSLFYKKTDSVLRGHLLAEMQGQMAVLGKEKGLLVPVNPLLGRTIKDGYYFINGQLVHETNFLADPEFPVRSSVVKEMLGDDGSNVSLLKNHQPLPATGIAVGEAQTMNDVAHWANDKNDDVLYAGGASFFDALLNTMYEKKATGGEARRLSMPFLLVSGTTFQKNKQHIKALSPFVCYMPDDVFRNTTIAEEKLEIWSEEIAARINNLGKAILAIGENKANGDANFLRESIGEAVKRVLQKTVVRELLIEGGSTAYAAVQKLGWLSFTPSKELAQGVVRMKVNNKDDLHLTIKPGSYDWPAEWNFEEHK